MNVVYYMGMRLLQVGPIENGWVLCLWPKPDHGRQLWRHHVSDLSWYGRTPGAERTAPRGTDALSRVGSPLRYRSSR